MEGVLATNEDLARLALALEEKAAALEAAANGGDSFQGGRRGQWVDESSRGGDRAPAR